MHVTPKTKNILSVNFYYNFFKKHTTLMDMLTTLVYIVFCIAQLAQVYNTQHSMEFFYFTIINMSFMTIMIFLRNRSPLLTLSGATIFPFLLALLESVTLSNFQLESTKLPLLVSSPIIEPIAITILLYTIGTKRSLKTAIACTTIVSTIIIILEITSNQLLFLNYSPLIINLTVFIIATLVGLTVQFHSSKVVQLEHLNKQLELERKQHEQLIISAERTRIAREMHDIVAHSLAIVITMADGAEAMLEKNPPLAKQAINQIQQTGRSALNETRRLVGILRENTQINTDELEELANEINKNTPSTLNQMIQKTGILQNTKKAQSSEENNEHKKNNKEKLAKKKNITSKIQTINNFKNTNSINNSKELNTQPYKKNTTDYKAPLTPHGSQSIESLIEEFKNAGLPIQYSYTGKPIEKDTALGLTTYRILQEALTNILRYAPFSPKVNVSISRFHGGMTIIVKNLAGVSTYLTKGSGKGIIGMRERAAVYDGYVQAGPTEDGWQVKAFLRLNDGEGETISWTAPS